MLVKLFQREKDQSYTTFGIYHEFLSTSTALVFSYVCITSLKNIQSRNLEVELRYFSARMEWASFWKILWAMGTAHSSFHIVQYHNI
jgi:hypothetical protein